MAYTKLGRIRPVYSGEWNSGRAYTALEMVRTSDGGLSYIAQKDVPAGTPLTNSEYWAVVLDVREVLEAAKNAADRINNVMDVKANALSATADGNPSQIHPDKDSLIKPILTFRPMQKGSGDPYPAGGGKNLLENTATSGTITNGMTYTVGQDGTISVTGTSVARSQLIVNPACKLPAGRYILSQGFIADVNRTGTMFARYTKPNGEMIYIDASGRSEVAFTLEESASLEVIAEFRSAGITAENFRFYPMIRLASIANATYQPYSNIRPITGRAGAELVRCGKNLLPFMMIGNTYAQSGMNAVVTDEGMVLNGTPLGAYNNLLHFVYSNLPAGTYTISGGDPATGVYAQMNITRADGTVQYYANAPFVIYGDEQRVVCFIQNSSVIPTMTNYVLKAQLELGSTATPFEPYQGDTYTLDFGQTVYGGKVDVNKGELVVDWAKVTLPSSANWVKSISAKNGYYLGDGNIFVPQKLYMCPVLCNVAKYTSDVEEYKANYGMVYSDSTISLNVDPAVCGSTLESFKAWLDSTEVQIAYKLANPITIRLTPQQITALAGVNTVYGDVDEITAHYNKSLNAALEELKNAILAMGGNV